ncbi:hypothetical protein SAY86_012103 [Trapa natans]|uniref:Uncharacterized protein n=1 Tax=Trapa natans TaxID=22666 RepID=A0AAN7LXH0_TRANT|nr:hypothetical protein SAY86_012103 [Trapa natans]
MDDPSLTRRRRRNLADEEGADEDYLLFLKNYVEYEEIDSGHRDLEANRGSANDFDQQLDSFLKHLWKDGKSYILLVEGSAGERCMYKYEFNEDLSSEGCNLQPKRSNLINGGVSERKECAASNIKSRKVLRNGNMAGKDGKHASKRRENYSRESSQPRELKCSEKPAEESELWDESYLVYMHHVRRDGDVVLLNCDDIKVRYQEDECEESSSSDLDILSPEDILKNKENNPFVSSRMTCMNLEAGDIRESVQSEFRQKLLGILKMPYNAEEYKDLWQKVHYRSLLEIKKEMRGGRERTYTTNVAGLSYLDQYPDLAGKLSSVKGDQLRTLNLLRGFFFYLSNLPMEGVFRPWQDPSCLLILPPLPHAVKRPRFST